MGYDKKARKEDRGDAGRRKMDFAKRGSRRISEQAAIDESLGDAEFEESALESEEVQKDHVS